MLGIIGLSIVPLSSSIITISIQSEFKDNYFIISMRDTGIGFTEDKRKRLFTQIGKMNDIVKEEMLGSKVQD